MDQESVAQSGCCAFLRGKAEMVTIVAAAFNAIQQNQFPNAEVTHDKDTKLKGSPIFGLGVVLLEIGRCQLLLEPTSESCSTAEGVERDEQSEMKERLEAYNHVLKKSVARELGPRYQDVVQKCIF